MAKINIYPILAGNKIIFGHRYELTDSEAEETADIIINELMYYNLSKKTILSIKTSDGVKKLQNILSTDTMIPEITTISDKETLEGLKETGFDNLLTFGTGDELGNRLCYAQYVRVDIHYKLCKNIVNMCKRLGKKVIICGINENSDYGKAEKLNPDYYEGLAVANIMASSANREEYFSSSVLTILAKIRDPDYDVNDIAKYISYDSKLAAAILRASNSIAFKHTGKEITTVREAVIRLGRESITYIAMIANNARVSNTAFGEVVKTSLMRGLLCKRIAEETKRRLIKSSKLEVEEAYMIGLFSELDILTHRSMRDVLSTIPHSRDIESALLYKDGIGGTILKLIIAYDENTNSRIEEYCRELGMSTSKLDSLYYTSVRETNKIWEEVCNGTAEENT